jgi:hypothetical protein
LRGRHMRQAQHRDDDETGRRHPIPDHALPPPSFRPAEPTACRQ